MSKASYARLRGAVLALAAAALPSVAFADHSWSYYHWAHASNPLTLSLGDNVSPTWEPYLAGASGDWNGSIVLYTRVVPGQARPKNCKPVFGRIEVCSERYGFNGWLGIAQVWLSGGHIVQATTRVNDSYFNTARYNTPAWRALVMCQEIGHTFGLDHQDENFDNANLGSCMDYSGDPDGPPSNEHPNQHDFEQLAAIYSHFESGAAIAQASANGTQAPAAEAAPGVGTAQWGRLIRSTNGGRTERYELDLGGGRKVFTFVIWADPDDQPGAGRGAR